MAQVRGRYSVTAIGGASVTLTPVAGREDEDRAGDPNVLGTGTVVLTTTGAPSTAFWKSGMHVLVEFSRVDL